MTLRLVLSIQQACLQETCATLSRRIGVDEGTIRANAKTHIAHLDRSLSFGVPSQFWGWTSSRSTAGQARS